MKIMTLFLLYFSTLSLASSHEKGIYSLMERYMQGFKSQDEKIIKSTVTYEYYKKLKENNLMRMSFLMQRRSPANKKINPFDIEIIKSRNSDTWLVKVKGKDQKHYPPYWYEIEKINQKFLIKNLIPLD